MGVWSTEYGVPVGSWCQVVGRGDALLLPGHVFVAWGARAQVGCEVGKDSVDRADLEQGQAASMYTGTRKVTGTIQVWHSTRRASEAWKGWSEERLSEMC